jgi:hypothetical protein
LLPLDLWSEYQQQVDEIRQALYQLCDSGYIRAIPNAQDYISPYIKQVNNDCPDNLVNEIVAQYIHNQEDDPDDNEPVILLPLVSHKETLHSLYQLQRYKEENKYGNTEFLKALRKQEREIKNRCYSSKTQSGLDQWLVESNKE